LEQDILRKILDSAGANAKESPHMKTHLATSAIHLTICATALLLSNGWCLAQDSCPDDGTVEMTPQETLGSMYQPYEDRNVLQRRRFVPPPPYASKYPTVLMLPADVYKLEYADNGDTSEKEASYDLQQAGFLVFQVEHRLAPPGALEYQLPTDYGRAPEQTDDLKRQILAALADPDCNGNIYLVGGSAGGTLVLWCALDPASTVSGWDETARSHIKAVVSLSGPTQFCDWTDPGTIPPPKVAEFESDLGNYVGLPTSPPVNCDPDCTGSATCALNLASPAWLVTHGATSYPPPFRLYATTGDPVPNPQAADMYIALTTQYGTTFDVQMYIMNYPYGDSHDHAYKYWHATNNASNGGGVCVSSQVISFLNGHL
jgi:acetyl esterase/lipase